MEREKWRERTERERREREMWRERERDRAHEKVGGRDTRGGACMQNNAYQFRITSESPRLVHTWYL